MGVKAFSFFPSIFRRPVRTHPLTANDKAQIRSNPTVASQFPVVFPNGYLVKSFSVGCLRCELDVPPEMIKGTVDTSYEGFATIRGFVVCPKCSLVVPIKVKLLDNGTYYDMSDTSGKIVEHSYIPIPMKYRVAKFVEKYWFWALLFVVLFWPAVQAYVVPRLAGMP